MFKDKYRIVTDAYAGYEVQVRKWYFPFWFQCGHTNTHETIDKAKEYISRHKKVVVYTEVSK